MPKKAAIVLEEAQMTQLYSQSYSSLIYLAVSTLLHYELRVIELEAPSMLAAFLRNFFFFNLPFFFSQVSST
jgi:hypothetical protein